MSQLIPAKSCFFFTSILFTDQHDEQLVISLISNKIGSGFQFKNNFFPMKNYYSKEMGNADNLKRIIYVSDALINRKELVNFKIWADKVEKDFSENGRRSINIDTGYISLENVVLATGKQFSHRIYLGHGVYADLNLIFEEDSFKSLTWTYPDYAHTEFIQFFNWCRFLLFKKLK